MVETRRVAGHRRHLLLGEGRTPSRRVRLRLVRPGDGPARRGRDRGQPGDHDRVPAAVAEPADTRRCCRSAPTAAGCGRAPGSTTARPARSTGSTPAGWSERSSTGTPSTRRCGCGTSATSTAATSDACYCDVSAEDFRRWLRERYGDLDALNDGLVDRVLVAAVRRLGGDAAAARRADASPTRRSGSTSPGSATTPCSPVISPDATSSGGAARTCRSPPTSSALADTPVDVVPLGAPAGRAQCGQLPGPGRPAGARRRGAQLRPDPRRPRRRAVAADGAGAERGQLAGAQRAETARPDAVVELAGGGAGRRRGAVLPVAAGRRRRREVPLGDGAARRSADTRQPREVRALGRELAAAAGTGRHAGQRRGGAAARLGQLVGGGGRTPTPRSWTCWTPTGRTTRRCSTRT